MKAGDTVQVRRYDGGDYWIFAKVLDPATRLVQVQHPGNAEDGKQLVMAAADIRTKADLQALVTTAQGMASSRLSDAQIQSLTASDGWFAQFLKPQGHMVPIRETLHQRIVKHFQDQANTLS